MDDGPALGRYGWVGGISTPKPWVDMDGLEGMVGMVWGRGDATPYVPERQLNGDSGGFPGGKHEGMGKKYGGRVEELRWKMLNLFLVPVQWLPLSYSIIGYINLPHLSRRYDYSDWCRSDSPSYNHSDRYI